MKIRTITLGLPLPDPLSSGYINAAVAFLRYAQERYEAAGYEVQTVRLATSPLLDTLTQRGYNLTGIRDYCAALEKFCRNEGLGFCSIGPLDATAPAASSDTIAEQIAALGELLLAYPLLTASVQLATPEYGLALSQAPAVAALIGALSAGSEDGIANFRFAMLANCPPGSPFFPAAYHQGALPRFSIGLQAASLVQEAFHGAADLQAGLAKLRRLFPQRVEPVEALARVLAAEAEIMYGGIDLSPAPLGEESIATAMEELGLGPFGGAGTLAIAAGITAILKSTTLQTCGYSGLMLPVLEDAGIGRRNAEGLLTVHSLLLYSAVCGTGLDTVPIPGDTPLDRIAALLLDVTMLATRLKKPLSARLFPVPGKAAGELTTFNSPYLTNTTVMVL